MKQDVICFHNPNEINGYLSNWYLSDFELDGITFTSMEQYMMYAKAVLFDDSRIRKQILATNDVGKIKRLGREVKNFNEATWVENRKQIVKKGLKAKFSQNQVLGRRLKGTGNTILAECAVKDTIWGIGLSMYNKDRFYPQKWTGLNLLGELLMEVRKEID